MECKCTDTQDHSCSSIDISLLEPHLAKFPRTGAKGDLNTILQITQDIYGYLPREAIEYIARRFRIKPAKVMGVVSFYTQFRTKPIGKNLILLCQGTACHVNGSLAIEVAIKDALGVGEGDISENGLFTYSNVACVGCCSLAPVIMVGDKTYGGLTRAKTEKIIKEIEQKEISV